MTSTRKAFFDYLRKDRFIQPLAIAASIGLAIASPVLAGVALSGLALGGGLYLLSKTSDTVLNNARAIGKKAGINPMTLGVVLGVLTSMPELFVSAGAMITGNPGIGIGNVVGSNIANILLILGGTAVVKKINTLGVNWKFNAAAMMGATMLFGAQMVTGMMSPVIGALLIAGSGAYIWKSMRDSKKEIADRPAAAGTAEALADGGVEPEQKLSKRANILLGLAGLGGLIGAASFVVSSAVTFGTSLGVSAAVVGVLAVAVGTSLPEVMVSLKAARKGDSGIVIGNILGSNFFNFAIIGGILSMSGAPMPDDFSARAGVQGMFNTAAVAGSAALAVAALAVGKNGIGRKSGIASLCLYAAFTAATFMMGKDKAPATVAPPAAIEKKAEIRKALPAPRDNVPKILAK